jgi:hypothetical protein
VSPGSWRQSILLSAGLSVALAGCGGSQASDGRAAVIKVERVYLSAAAAGSGAVTCEQMTLQARRRVVRNGRATGAHTCAAVFSRAARELSAADRRALRNARVVTVRIAGDRAQIKLRGEPTSSLVRIQGRWRVN